MSNIYESAREKWLKNGANLDTGPVNAYLVPASYVPNYGAHSTVSNLGATLASAVASGVTVTDGVFNSAAVTFTSVTNATPAARVVFAVGTALVACIDDFGAGSGNTSLPLNGSDVVVTPGSPGWFVIGNA